MCVCVCVCVRNREVYMCVAYHPHQKRADSTHFPDHLSRSLPLSSIKTWLSIHVTHSYINLTRFVFLSHQKFNAWPLFKHTFYFAAILKCLKTNIFFEIITIFAINQFKTMQSWDLWKKIWKKKAKNYFVSFF